MAIAGLRASADAALLTSVAVPPAASALKLSAAIKATLAARAIEDLSISYFNLALERAFRLELPGCDHRSSRTQLN